MNEIIKEIENAQLKESVPAFEVGDTVRVHNRIQEGNKSRIQIFEGTVQAQAALGVQSPYRRADAGQRLLALYLHHDEHSVL